MPRFKKKLGTVLGLTTAGIYLMTALIVMVLININMRNESLFDARQIAKIVLSQNVAIHSYFSQKLKPDLFKILKNQGVDVNFFDPALMSSTFAVRWIENDAKSINSELSNYSYKSSAINARSPEYEASPFEIDYLKRASAEENPEDWSGVVQLDGEPHFVYLKPNARFTENCMRCHSEPDKAPAELLELYGSERSFWKKAGQISSVISLRIPLSVAYGKANKTSLLLCLIYTLLMLLAWSVNSYILRRLIVAPVKTVRDQAMAITSGKSPLGEQIPLPGYEEMHDLAGAFNQMSLRLKAHQDNLVDTVAQRTEELEIAYANLKKSQSQLVQNEKLASIGQLAAGVAHEINNPIGFVKSNLGSLDKYFSKLMKTIDDCRQLLEKHGNVELNAELKTIMRQNKFKQICEDFPELIEESADGINRVSTIVQNLKTFSRVDNKTWSQCDLNQSLESALNIVWNELKFKITLHKDFAELPTIKCFPQQISQVLMNLLVNAGHAIEERGDIWLKTWQAGDKVFLSVADNGCGMSFGTQQQIFEPFFTTKAAGKGTGLGMSIVSEIIQKHSGTIEVESTLGQGSKITISFPLKDIENF